MHTRDYRDLIAGAVLIVIGAAAAFHSITSLGVGTLLRLGPGGFPAALGVILVAFGLGIGIPAWNRAGTLPQVDFVALGAILASILAFLVLLRPFGIIPAVLALTIVSTRADSKLSPVGTIVLAVTLAAMAALIFVVGLGIRVPLAHWPW